nr:hypothetical protein [Stackebrandtia endophytica]
MQSREVVGQLRQDHIVTIIGQIRPRHTGQPGHRKPEPTRKSGVVTGGDDLRRRQSRVGRQSARYRFSGDVLTTTALDHEV